MTIKILYTFWGKEADTTLSSKFKEWSKCSDIVLDYIISVIYSIIFFMMVSCRQCVIYWPLTELSIKRWTCVNKWKNKGSRWTLDNNITRCPDGSSQLETGCQRENQLANWGLCGPQWPMVEQPKPRWERSTVGSIWQSVLVSTHFSHTTNITLLKIKCERYIFIKQCILLLLKSSLPVNDVSACKCILVYVHVQSYSCEYTTNGGGSAIDSGSTHLSLLSTSIRFHPNMRFGFLL